MASPIKDALEKVGVSTSALDRIVLAQGVVGKSSYVAGAAIIALAVVGFNLKDPTYLLAIGVLIVLLFAAYFGGVLWFAHKHPGEALLEGAELIQWRQMDMAAKNVTDSEKLEGSGRQLLGGGGN